MNKPPDADALFALAQAGGSNAALAARRAAWLAEREDPALASRALRLAVQLEPSDPAPRLALARLAAERGDLTAARAEAAVVLSEATDQAARARAAFILGEIERVTGDRGSARNAYQTVLRIEDAILSADRRNATAARWYARARGRIAELDAGEAEYARARTGAEGALAILRATAANIGEPPVLAADIADAEMRLGALELDSNQPASARRRLGEAIARYEALAITEKEEPHWRAVLADAWALASEADYLRGDPDAARAAMDKALQARLRLAARHESEAWGLAGVWRLRGALRGALGDGAEAADSFAQARALAEQLTLRAGGADAQARFLVHTLLDQADEALRAGDSNVAREAADSARARAEFSAGKTGASAIWLTDAAAAWDRLGEVARMANAKTQMLDAFARALEFRRMARDRSQDDARFARGLAAALVKLGEAALACGQIATARNAFQESVGLRLALYQADPGSPRAAQALAVALERLGLAAQAAGDLDTARAAWEDELVLAHKIFTDESSIETQRFLAIVESHLANVSGSENEAYRTSALERFNDLAKAGVLTEREAVLRKRLWGG